jgi:hypothetical protein
MTFPCAFISDGISLTKLGYFNLHCSRDALGYKPVKKCGIMVINEIHISSGFVFQAPISLYRFEVLQRTQMFH